MTHTPVDRAAGIAPVPRRAARTATVLAGTGTPGPVRLPDCTGPGPSALPPLSPSRTSAATAGETAPARSDASPSRATERDRAPSQASAGGADPGSAVPSAGSTQPRTWTIELPPGLPLLSLNGREHWAARHRKTQALKKAAWAMALQAKIPPLGRVTITAQYQPPDRRHRDADNPVASLKACIDGIVTAGCLPSDDSRYVASVTCVIGPVYPKGRLVLHITEVPGGAA